MRIGKIGIALLALFATMAVASPAAAQDKMVNCKDGTTSKAGRGACSGHGGVGEAAPAKAEKGGKGDAKAAKADAKMDAKAAKAAKADAAPAKGDMKAAKADAKAAAPAPAPAAKAAPAPAKAAPAAAEGKPTAKCKDGTMSYAKNHTGACSSHGGVAEWLDGTAKKP